MQAEITLQKTSIDRLPDPAVARDALEAFRVHAVEYCNHIDQSPALPFVWISGPRMSGKTRTAELLVLEFAKACEVMPAYCKGQFNDGDFAVLQLCREETVILGSHATIAIVEDVLPDASEETVVQCLRLARDAHEKGQCLIWTSTRTPSEVAAAWAKKHPELKREADFWLATVKDRLIKQDGEPVAFRLLG
jgi:hypothetical protein